MTDDFIERIFYSKNKDDIPSWEKKKVVESRKEEKFLVKSYDCKNCSRIKCQVLEYIREKDLRHITSMEIRDFLVYEMKLVRFDDSTPAKILFRLRSNNWINVWGKRTFKKGDKKYLVYTPSKKYHNYLKSHKNFLELCRFMKERIITKPKEMKPMPRPVKLVEEGTWIER